MRRLAVLLALLVLVVPGTASALDKPVPDPGTPVSNAPSGSYAKADANRAKAMPWLRRHARGAYAGSFYTGDRRISWVATFTSDFGRFERRLRKVVPYPDRLEVRPVMYSEHQLGRISNRIGDDLDWLHKRRVLVTAVEPDLEANTVVIGLHPDSRADAVAILRERYAKLGPIQVEASGWARLLPLPADGEVELWSPFGG
jgi:hypothetical protein